MSLTAPLTWKETSAAKTCPTAIVIAAEVAVPPSIRLIVFPSTTSTEDHRVSRCLPTPRRTFFDQLVDQSAAAVGCSCAAGVVVIEEAAGAGGVPDSVGVGVVGVFQCRCRSADILTFASS